MNKLEVKKLSSKIKKARKIIINPIKILAKDQKNNNHKIFAINEILLFRQSRQTANVLVKKIKNYYKKTYWGWCPCFYSRRGWLIIFLPMVNSLLNQENLP